MAKYAALSPQVAVQAQVDSSSCVSMSVMACAPAKNASTRVTKRTRKVCERVEDMVETWGCCMHACGRGWKCRNLGAAIVFAVRGAE